MTATVTVFMVHTRRTADAARAILGRANGVLVSDRHGAYNWWPVVKHQFCWAHLRRDFVKIAERGCDSERIGNALLAETERMFLWWHRVRDGTLARSTFRVYMRSLQHRVEALLAEGAAGPHFKTARTCVKLLKHADALWTFLYIEGVEPTNNTAERAVRHGVLYRKGSYGTHSDPSRVADGRRLGASVNPRRWHRTSTSAAVCYGTSNSRLLSKPSPSEALLATNDAARAFHGLSQMHR